MKVKITKESLKLLGSLVSLTLISVLILHHIGWIGDFTGALEVAIAAILLGLVLLKINWLNDVGEITGTLLVIIIISQLLLGPKMLVPLVAVTSQSMLHQPGDNSWETWLIDKGISPEKIATFPLKSGFDRGDMILVKTPNDQVRLGWEFPSLFSPTKLGDVVIYNRDKEHGNGEPIIHRVVGIVRIENWSVSETEGTLSCLTKDDFNKRYIPFVVNCINGKKCPYREFPTKSDFNFYLTKGDNNGKIDQCSPISYPINEQQLSARGWIRIPYLGWLKLILNNFLHLFIS